MSLFNENGKRGAVALGITGSMFLFGYAVGVASPWFALTAAFVLLGLLDLLRPYAVLRVPGAVFRIREWERRGVLYRHFGVVAFGRLLRRSPLKHLNRRVYLAAQAGDLEQVRSEVSAAEAAHFWAGIMTLPYLAVAVARGWWNSLVAVIAFDVAVNLLPILHLRWVRSRLGRASTTGPLRRSSGRRAERGAGADTGSVTPPAASSEPK